MRLIFSICLFFTLGLGLPGQVSADKGGTSLDEAVKRLKAKPDVRVLSAQRVTVDGKPMYRIKVLTGNGRVKYVWVDPGS